MPFYASLRLNKPENAAREWLNNKDRMFFHRAGKEQPVP